MTTFASNSDLIVSYLHSFSKANPALVASHVTSDFINRHLSILGAGCEGKEVYEQRLADFFGSFQGIAYQVSSVVADSRIGAAQYVMTFSVGDKPISISGMMWFEFKGKLISKRIDCWDSLNYLMQTGASASEIENILKKKTVSASTKRARA